MAPVSLHNTATLAQMACFTSQLETVSRQARIVMKFIACQCFLTYRAFACSGRHTEIARWQRLLVRLPEIQLRRFRNFRQRQLLIANPARQHMKLPLELALALPDVLFVGCLPALDTRHEGHSRLSFANSGARLRHS